jgi:hypothetical protein
VCRLDVDGNDIVDGTTDVVYIARYVFGLSPAPPSFRLQDPTIPTDTALAAAITTLCP